MATYFNGHDINFFLKLTNFTIPYVSILLVTNNWNMRYCFYRQYIHIISADDMIKFVQIYFQSREGIFLWRIESMRNHWHVYSSCDDLPRRQALTEPVLRHRIYPDTRKQSEIHRDKTNQGNCDNLEEIIFKTYIWRWSWKKK